jgi:hypothetical protein
VPRVVFASSHLASAATLTLHLFNRLMLDRQSAKMQKYEKYPAS